MLFFTSDALVELLLRVPVLLSASLKLTNTLIALAADDARDVLQVVQEDFALFLFLGILVSGVDLAHVVQLLVEVLLRVDQRVEQVAVLAVLFRLEVERVEQLHQTLRELRDFDV